MDEKPDRFKELMARALASVEADEFRSIIGESINKCIQDYDMKRLISAAVEPIALQMLKDMLNKPEMVEMIKDRAWAQLRALVMNFTVSPGRGY
jgi:hypothetical protein